MNSRKHTDGEKSLRKILPPFISVARRSKARHNRTGPSQNGECKPCKCQNTEYSVGSAGSSDYHRSSFPFPRKLLMYNTPLLNYCLVLHFVKAIKNQWWCFSCPLSENMHYLPQPDFPNQSQCHCNQIGEHILVQSGTARIKCQ